MTDVYYTLMPPQMVFFDEKAVPESQLLCYKGVNLYARPYDAGHYQITGLCTTNPKYYLSRELQPGALIPILGKSR